VANIKDEMENDFKEFDHNQFKDINPIKKWKEKQIRALIKTYNNQQKGTEAYRGMTHRLWQLGEAPPFWKNPIGVFVIGAICGRFLTKLGEELFILLKAQF